ncbi:MAG: FAD:protein FMN transferase [Betaproteobacteria bacterium]|nr:FAD:protein FMN transferase [Betaproteobacteria bacterium]
MEAELARRCQPLLGTLVEVSVPAASAAAVDAAFAAIRHVHQHMSFHEQDSDLWRLRVQPAGASVAVDPQTVDVLRLARELHSTSGGLFDVTVGRELVGSGFLPRAGIADLRDFPGGMADLEIVDEEHVRCQRPMLIDLGGIAKGYAVDRAVEALKGHGLSEGLVNAGGDLRMFGGRPWPIALRQADGRIGRSVMLADCALASSANLLDRRRWRGRDWTPHLDGSHRPVVAPGSIHVVADRCSIADAMTKVAMSDPELAGRLLAAHRGYLLAPSNIGNAA